MIETRYFTKFHRIPISLLGLTIILCCIGFVVLYSAGGGFYPLCYKQLINFSLFLPVAVIIAIIDIKVIFRFSYLFYFFVLVLLLAIELFGVKAMGAKRWINLGFMQMQPSELVKIAIVLMIARYFHQLDEKDVLKTHKILPVIVAILIPSIFIIKQPDLGTGLITLIVAGTMLFASGIQVWKFIVSAFSICAFMPIAWSMMYEYQKRRVLVFLDPEIDSLGSGYNIIQSKIAIGSGGFFGKGFNSGTQSHLAFLPEHETDFIFATFAEEFGFIGGVILLLIYTSLVCLSLLVSYHSKSIFAKLMVIGITTILASHVFINMAMVMDMAPAVGVPLPFLSYGGTMMGSMLIGVGLIMNAQVHQHSNV